MDPYKTILVCKHDGREVGRIPATAPNASKYVEGLVLQYGSLEMEHEADPTGGLLAVLHQPKRPIV